MIGHKITRFDQLESTNNFVAKELEIGKYATGEVIMARFQSKGRGQRGNMWQSEQGSNLTFSFAIPSNFLDIHQHFILSKAVSVAIYEMLTQVFHLDTHIKWPNDILVDKQKICGILLETKVINTQKFTIVGIGLNVNQDQFQPGFKATSIAIQMGRKVALEMVLRELINRLNIYLSDVSQGFFDDVEYRYNKSLYGMGGWIELTEGYRNFLGQIKHVDNEGVMVVRSKQGHTKEFRAKEVKIRY